MKISGNLLPPSLRDSTFRSGTLLLASKVFTQACVFTRNLIVVRLIGVENFGIAATFSMTASVLDMLGALSVDQMLIQARDGNDEKLQATAHTIQAIRGVVTGFILLAFAEPMSALFAVPEAVSAFRWLSLIPVLRGFFHLDSFRLQREMKYRAAIGLDLIRELLPTLLAWPLAIWLKDYSVVLWLLILQAAIMLLASQLSAERIYRWHWSSAYSRRFLNFGWPLIANSILLFAIFQGDRFLIGTAGSFFPSSTFTIRDLGVYSVALSLTLVPTMALGNVTMSLMLPLFSRAQTSFDDLIKRYSLCSQGLALLSGLFALPFMVAGGWIISSLYGSQYEGAGEFIGWLAVMQSIRMARLAPTVAAMSVADTRNALYSNAIRCLALAATIPIISAGGGLEWVAIAGCGGELAAWIVCLWKLERDHGIPLVLGVKANAPVVFFLGGSGLLLLLDSEVLLGKLLMLGILIFVYLAAMLWLFPRLRSLLQMNLMRSVFNRPTT